MIQRRPPSSRRTPRAFTIVELMVAVTILTILLTATSVIWTSQQKIIQIAAAQEEVSPYGRALESNLRRDLQGLSRDGFMVISSNPQSIPANGFDPPGNYNFDQFLFFSNGLKTAVRSPAAVALTSRIWYGHLRTNDWGGNALSPAAGVPPWKLSLGRQDLLLQPGNNGVIGPSTITDLSIVSGTVDYAITDLLTVKQAMFNAVLPATPAQNMANACFRIVGQRYVNPSDPNTFSGVRGLMDIHALMAPFCSSFTVQFAGRYSYHIIPQAGDTPPGQMDLDAFGKVVWYGTDPTTGVIQPPAVTFPSGNSQAIGNSFVFSPDQPATWPMAIQVTVDLHDSNGRIHERFRKLLANATLAAAANLIDGYRYRFIIKL